MKDETLILIVGILCISLLSGTIILINRIDGILLSGIVGAIVFIITKKKYVGNVL